MWIVHQQLFFHCTLRPMHAASGAHNSSSEDIGLDLDFVSAFEDLCLRISGTIDSNAIRMLYGPFPVPTLYVGRVEDLRGRVPPFPCFLDDNTTSTIWYKYAARQKQAFVFGCPGQPSF